MLRSLAVACVLFAFSAFAQNLRMAPIPTSQYELVKPPIRVLGETDQRATILGLIERARQNSDLHAPGGHPYLLKATFEASGNVAFTGSGRLEELWYGPGMWRWNAQFGSYTQNRMALRGALYEENSSPMPLRLQMVRGNIFWPIMMMPGEALRISAANWHDQSVMCVLGSRNFGNAASLPARRWEETEFCLDAKSGLLQTYSIAPGMYAVYHYQNAIKFHASTLPRLITIFEGNAQVLSIHLDSVSDATPLDEKQFIPSAQMHPLGGGGLITGTYRFPLFGGAPPVDTHGMIQPVIVHATITPDNKVQEVEAVQDSEPALSAAAVNVVKNAQRFPWPERQYPGQREAYINVRFVPAVPQNQGR
jgi:Gram-negative bacterial TonB protein C-terminal